MGYPIALGARTNRRASWTLPVRQWLPVVLQPGYSLNRSFLVAHHRDEEIRDARCAHFAEPGELFTIGVVKKHDAAPKHVSRMNGPERLRIREVIRMDHHFGITRFKLLHAALEHDAAVIDEHEIGQHVLDLFYLVGRDDDGPIPIEVIVEEGVVELLPVKDI